MVLSPSNPPLLPLSLLLLPIFALAAPSDSSPDSNPQTLIYSNCANQTFQNYESQEALISLLDSLTTQSTTAKFFKTTSGTSQPAITALFQCRGDLDTASCTGCVNQLVQVSQQVCGESTSARVQIDGCYLYYEVAGSPQIPAVHMWYKTCSTSQATEGGFEDRRNTAFADVVRGVVGESGFYAGSGGSVKVVGQCEGDLAVSDCGECIQKAVEKVVSECGDSISAEIYLNECFLSYSDGANGVATTGGAGARSGAAGAGAGNMGRGMVVALVIGGVVFVWLWIAFLLFISSLYKNGKPAN